MKKIVHVVGTGTIGEPLIGLFTDFRAGHGDRRGDLPQAHAAAVRQGEARPPDGRGAKLAVDPEVRDEFERLGHKVSYDSDEALERATVVIDCTPAGNENKERYYSKLDGPRGFLAQGSEFGFGKPYARGVNDEALDSGGRTGSSRSSRATPTASPTSSRRCATRPGEERAGRRDRRGRSGLEPGARRLRLHAAGERHHPGVELRAVAPGGRPQGRRTSAPTTPGTPTPCSRPWAIDLDLFSSAVKLNTQYMHSLWFHLTVKRDVTLEELSARFRSNARVAMTAKKEANLIFSFGRDHGYYGRILSQVVVVEPSLAVRRGREVFGFAFTPQDGNSLLSSIAAALWRIEPDWESVQKRLNVIRASSTGRSDRARDTAARPTAGPGVVPRRHRDLVPGPSAGPRLRGRPRRSPAGRLPRPLPLPRAPGPRPRRALRPLPAHPPPGRGARASTARRRSSRRWRR